MFVVQMPTNPTVDVTVDVDVDVTVNEIQSN